jgi:hypothetical protein
LPEGNARLAHHLQKICGWKIVEKSLVYNIKIEGNKAIASVLIIKPKHQLPLLQIKFVSNPQFVNQSFRK